MTALRRARELFVWYRVDARKADRVRIEVDAMQRALETQCPGLRARLLIRADAPGPQTWMETYALGNVAASGDSTRIDDQMQARIEAAAAPIRRWIESDRHVERFEVVDLA